MRRPLGLDVVSVAALVSGATSAAALTVATRSLGAVTAAPLAVAWTLAVVAGPGVWFAREVEVAREEAVAASPGASPGLVALIGRRASVAAAIAAFGGLLLRHKLFDGGVAVPLALAGVTVAYGPLHIAWGRLAGRGRRRALAVSVAVEGPCRLLVVGGAALLTHNVGACAGGLMVAVCLSGAIASGIAASPTAHHRHARRVDGPTNHAHHRWARGLTWASLLGYAVPLSAPALFELLNPPDDPRTARLALALLLARGPVLAWKGVVSALAPSVASRLAAGERDVTRTAGGLGLRIALAVGLPTAFMASLAGDAVLDVLTGSDIHLGGVPLALLGLGTASHLGALTVTSAMAGAGRGREAGWAWSAGAGMAAVVLALSGDPLLGVVGALAAGTTTALVCLMAAAGRATAAGVSPPEGFTSGGPRDVSEFAGEAGAGSRNRRRRPGRTGRAGPP